MMRVYAEQLSVGEDALANLSVERTEAGNIVGHVRIRSKTQGIALSLGDRITMGMLILLTVTFHNSLMLIFRQHKKITSLLYRRFILCSLWICPSLCVISCPSSLNRWHTSYHAPELPPSFKIHVVGVDTP